MLKVVVENDAFFDVMKIELQNGIKEVMFKVKGTSMWPFYLDNKTVVYVASPKQLRKYDVVLADYDNQVLLHRIIKIEGSTYTLRGDATYRKEVVDFKDIFAKVTHHQTNKKRSEQSKWYRLTVILWVNNPFRKILLKLRSK
ncbi:S24/S26 family peptidase [Acholeplasma vituli]|uniref:S24/S26 family peptidase n=1 Tax=Paracholeplasma vituli TaxID=69473 RepID=A0ABT2PXH7_9MOLU|nr:S24/S26 family peptidase [Paracholeplasma vituli]MCU0105642.1 S24/S26 family peptidase [Paracholeplasma vituli]